MDSGKTEEEYRSLQQDNHVGLYSKTTSREISRTKYFDLAKAVDTVSRDGLWKIIANFGCPPRFIAMVRRFHNVM